MYEVELTDLFKRKLKKLSKNYPQVKKDISGLVDQLESGDLQGDELQGFFGSVYKARVGSIDQKRGKRGGFRVIYYAITHDGIVFLLTIYAKAQQADLSHKQMQDLKELIESLK